MRLINLCCRCASVASTMPDFSPAWPELLDANSSNVRLRHSFVGRTLRNGSRDRTGRSHVRHSRPTSSQSIPKVAGAAVSIAGERHERMALRIRGDSVRQPCRESTRILRKPVASFWHMPPAKAEVTPHQPLGKGCEVEDPTLPGIAIASPTGRNGRCHRKFLQSMT